MIEVLSSFNCTLNTFFVAIDVMDTFFEKSARRVDAKDIHLVGVTSMLIASKLEEIIPFKVSTVVEKMTHNKLRARDIVDCELEILSALGFNFYAVSPLFVVIEMLFVKLGLYNQELTPDLLKVITYVAKMVMHDYSLLSKFPLKYIAASCVYICFKIIEQVNKDFKTRAHVDKIKAALELDDGFFYKSSEVVLNLAKNFEGSFPFAKNLQRFDAFTLEERTRSRGL